MGTFRRSRLPPGIYDEVITGAVATELEHLDAATKSLQDLTADVKAHPWKLLRKGS